MEDACTDNRTCVNIVGSHICNPLIQISVTNPTLFNSTQGGETVSVTLLFEPETPFVDMSNIYAGKLSLEPRLELLSESALIMPLTVETESYDPVTGLLQIDFIVGAGMIYSSLKNIIET